MTPEPLVSILMNCYNGEKYLTPAIESVLAQTYRNWEIIFWDNQSTDRSAEIFRSYRDSRLKYFYAPTHTWLYEARNYAIEKTGGEFVAFLDVDDWWLPEKLQKQVVLFDDSEVGFVCSNFWVENERNNKRWKFHSRPAPTGWVLDELLTSQIIGLVTLIIRRSALDSLDYGCDPRYHIIGDMDLSIRLSLRWKMGCVHEPTACYRLHDANETSKHRNRHIDEIRTWISEMQLVDAIRSSSRWSTMEQKFAYLRAMNELLDGHRSAAFRVIQELPWGKLRARISLALMLPTSVVRRVKN